MKSLLNARLGEPVIVQTYAPTHDEAEDAYTDAWEEGPTLRAVVSMPTSDEVIQVGGDTTSRRKIVRFYGAVALHHRDQLIIRGETYEIDGIPTTSRTVSGVSLTTISAVKQGSAS